MPPPRYFLNERHCEVHVLGCLMREVYFASTQKDRTHNCVYTFDLEPLPRGRYHTQHTFRIIVHLRGQRHNRAPEPAPGSIVYVQLYHQKWAATEPLTYRGKIGKGETSQEVIYIYILAARPPGPTSLFFSSSVRIQKSYSITFTSQ